MAQQLPGMGPVAPRLPSEDPVLASQAAEVYARQRAQDLTTAIEKSAMLSGDIEKNFSSILDRVTGVAQQFGLGVLGGTATPGATSGADPTHPSRNTASPSAPGQRTWAHIGSAPSTAASPYSAPPAPAPDARARPEGRVGGQRQPQQTTPIKQIFTEGEERAHKMTMGSIARAVAAPAAKYTSEHGPDWKYSDPAVTDEHGVAGDGSYINEKTGAKVLAGSPEHAKVGRAISRSGMITGNLAKFAAGEQMGGTLGTLGSVATKFAGPVGMAVGALVMGGHALEGQRQDASQYRQAFGDQGTGGFAAKDRWAEKMAGFSGFGSIGGDRAREEFQQASALGLRGGQRDQARDFSRDMYMKLGMDTSESMALVQQAITTGNVSLSAFSKAIMDVSASAVKAGVASNEAVKEFAAAQQAVATNIVSGDASTAIASNLTNVSLGMGKTLSAAVGGASGLARMDTDQQAEVSAAFAGKSPTAALFARLDPATADKANAQTMKDTGERMLSMMATHFGMTVAQMRTSALKKSGGQAEISQPDQYDLFKQWAGSEEQAGSAVQVLGVAIESIGMTGMPESQWLAFFFSTLLKGVGGEDAKKGKGGTGLKGGSTAIDYSKGASKSDLLSASGYTPRKTATFRDAAAPNAGHVQGNPADAAAFSAYEDQVNKTHTGNTAIQALLTAKSAGKIKEITGTDPSKAKFRVMDKSGKAQDLTLAEVIKQGYANQLSSGKAEVVGQGDNNLHRVSEITGIADGGTGTSASTDKPGAQQGVLIGLTDDAKKLIKQLPAGPSESQRAGLPAPASSDPGAWAVAGSK